MTQTPASPSHGQYSSTEPRTDGHTVTAQDDISSLLDALNDADARAILQTIEDEPLSAKQLSERCELPMSTTYRKVKQLSRVGILEEKIDINHAKKPKSRYTRCLDTLQLSITADGFELELSAQE
jgi:DNA-binding transcriptional ArsR family regulator